MTKKVLMVCTSCAKYESGDATGTWAEEVVHPWNVFKKHGFQVTLASIKGGEIPFDDTSLNPPFLTKEVEAFILDDDSMNAVFGSVPLSDVKADDFDALFLPGGHGTCFDFPGNAALQQLVEAFASQGKVVSAVCHGPMGLVDANGPDGKPLVAGKKVTAFSDAEEYAVAREKDVPFLLESKLKELGAVYECAKDKWAPHAVRDGNLVTGQNPASSTITAELIVEALS